MRPNFNSKPVIACLALALLLSSLSFKCDGGGQAPSDAYRKAAKASDDIAEAISAMIDAKRKLALNRTISPAEELLLTDNLLRINTAEKVFLTQLRQLKSTPDAAAKANLAKLFANVSSAIDDLSKGGISSLENPQARDPLMRIVAIMNAAAQIIDAFLRP
jgi:hypothetical protein